jgi:hypothetical protein
MGFVMPSVRHAPFLCNNYIFVVPRVKFGGVAERNALMRLAG